MTAQLHDEPDVDPVDEAPVEAINAPAPEARGSSPVVAALIGAGLILSLGVIALVRFFGWWGLLLPVVLLAGVVALMVFASRSKRKGQRALGRTAAKATGRPSGAAKRGRFGMPKLAGSTGKKMPAAKGAVGRRLGVPKLRAAVAKKSAARAAKKAAKAAGTGGARKGVLGRLRGLKPKAGTGGKLAAGSTGKKQGRVRSALSRMVPGRKTGKATAGSRKGLRRLLPGGRSKTAAAGKAGAKKVSAPRRALRRAAQVAALPLAAAVWARKKPIAAVKKAAKTVARPFRAASAKAKQAKAAWKASDKRTVKATKAVGRGLGRGLRAAARPLARHAKSTARSAGARAKRAVPAGLLSAAAVTASWGRTASGWFRTPPKPAVALPVSAPSIGQLGGFWGATFTAPLATSSTGGRSVGNQGGRSMSEDFTNEPEGMLDFGRMLTSEAEQAGERTARIKTWVDRAESERPLNPAAADSIREIADAAALLEQMIAEASATFNRDHADDIERLENPRTHEEDWDVSRNDA